MTAAAIDTPTVVIGASAAGLATSACLTRADAPHLLIEQSDAVGARWRQHYDRLHLHTSKRASGLPFVPFDPSVPRYPSRDQVVAYLESYVEQLGLRPRCGETVTRVHHEPGQWVTETSAATYRSRHVVLATGMARAPVVPDWPGASTYTGEVRHSSTYRNGEPWSGRRVLVVGFGNSAGEIALDLHEHGAHPTLAVRGGVNIIPRDLLGRSALEIGAAMSVLPPRVADAAGAPLIRMSIGDVRRLGLTALPYGPQVQTRRYGRIPLVDIGTVAAIRAGDVGVRGGVADLTAEGVRFDDGTEEPYDAIIAATGYRAELDVFLDAPDALDEDRLPHLSGAEVLPGLYFCGFHVSPVGMLRQIGRESRAIARSIAG